MSVVESTIYGVDYHGKVSYLNPNPTNGTSVGCIWTALPNPTNVSIKRLASFNKFLWGISSDHQIFVYVPKSDIYIRVREEIYENQRWNPIEGFCNSLLVTDREKYSNEDGTQACDKDAKLPSDSWQWEGDWQIENTFENQLLSEGWTYAIDFPASYHPEKSWKSCVRRRKLFRFRRYVGVNRWNRIEPLHKDHTKEPFIDVAVGCLSTMLNPDTCCLWAVSILGEVYFRTNTSITNPEGSNWKNISIRKGLEACQVTVGRTGVPFVVTWTGSFMYRIGLTPKNLSGTDWLEAEGPPGGLMQISAGQNSLWAVTRDKKCWALKGDLQEILVQLEPTFEWIEIPGKTRAISVGRTDDAILRLSDEDDDGSSSLYLRFGVSEDQKHGQGWKAAFSDISWDTMSIASTHSEISSDSVDGSGDTVSLRAEVPQTTPYCGNSSSFTPNNLCWVDGACASALRHGSENDLEVGPWREDILGSLQKLKVDKQQFGYPDAVEPTSTSWSKSVRAKFRHVSRKSKWADGQLEISDNNHLMFHENLEKSWLCPLSDILSVFDGKNEITFRIRNGIEPGIADIVTFKFLNEKDTEEWRSLITEQSKKPLEEFSIANIWLTTHEGEIHQAGQLKILDIPTDAEVITAVPGSDLQLHHPLVRGFLPGSEIQVDIILIKGAQRFSLNLNGKTNLTAFHFNPRLPDGHVVRNTCENNEWGPEETDGVFPFREGHGYSISIQCTATHILTTVKENKHKFIYSYKHRVPPKTICNLFIHGDVNVTSVRYDPNLGEDSYQLEFVSSPVPGHFWKVESAPNNSVWALGYDLNVWCHSGVSQKQSDNQFSVTDEQTFYVYENQRWNPITGFGGTHSLPTDRHGWTDETGRIRLEKDEIRLPFGKWSWVTEWEIDYETPQGVDENGWQYAVDFPATYHPSKRLKDFARRRRWKRLSRFTAAGPWTLVGNMKLVDLSIRMNEDCEWEVLGLCQNGDAVVRSGITPEVLAGDRWERLSTEKPLVSISGWFSQRVWAVGKDGFAHIRYGNSWQLLDRPCDTPLKTIKVGPSAVWAVGVNNVLYRRTEIQAVFPEGREWIKVCDGVSQISMSPDGSIWALLKTDGHGTTYRYTVAKRMGVTLNNPGGLGWELVCEGPWRYLTVSGCFSRNR